MDSITHLLTAVYCNYCATLSADIHTYGFHRTHVDSYCAHFDLQVLTYGFQHTPVCTPVYSYFISADLWIPLDLCCYCCYGGIDTAV
jgi:hypothetical protein